MLTSNTRNRLLTMACTVLFVGLTIASAGAQEVSQCTRTSYEAGNLWIVNSCSVPVTVKFTSDSGNTYGQTDIGADNRAMVSASGVGYEPRRDGDIYTFTCPRGSLPVLPDGSPWIPNNYRGRYHCQR